MKTAEVSFQFPVLGFTTDGEIWGFPDLNRLTKCGPRTLRNNMQDGMELIDAEGRRWRVLSITRTGRAGGWWTMFSPLGPSQWRIEQDLEPMAPVALTEVQRRACAAMEAFAQDYMDGDDRSELDALLAQVTKAAAIGEIYPLLNPDTFEPC